MDRDFLTDLSTKIVLGVKNIIFRIDMVIFWPYYGMLVAD